MAVTIESIRFLDRRVFVLENNFKLKAIETVAGMRPERKDVWHLIRGLGRGRSAWPGLGIRLAPERALSVPRAFASCLTWHPKHDAQDLQSNLLTLSLGPIGVHPARQGLIKQEDPRQDHNSSGKRPRSETGSSSAPAKRSVGGKISDFNSVEVANNRVADGPAKKQPRSASVMLQEFAELPVVQKRHAELRYLLESRRKIQQSLLRVASSHDNTRDLDEYFWAELSSSDQLDLVPPTVIAFELGFLTATDIADDSEDIKYLLAFHKHIRGAYANFLRDKSYEELRKVEGEEYVTKTGEAKSEGTKAVDAFDSRRFTVEDCLRECGFE